MSATAITETNPSPAPAPRSYQTASPSSYTDGVSQTSHHPVDQELWKECGIDLFPEPDVEGHSFPCYFDNENGFRNQSASSGTPTPTEGAAEQSETASPEDDESAANVVRPSLTLVGWMVAFLSVGAGFVA